MQSLVTDFPLLVILELASTILVFSSLLAIAVHGLNL